SKAALEQLILGKDVTIYTGEPAKDRHGRWLGYVMVGDTWVQEQMLKTGMARYYAYYGQEPIHKNNAYDAQLQQAENTARQNKTGLWAHPFYQILTPESVHNQIGTYG